jgi:hypothetical protein
VFSRDAWRCVWHMIQVWIAVLQFLTLSLLRIHSLTLSPLVYGTRV